MRIGVSDLIPVRLHWKKDELGVCVCVCILQEHSVLSPAARGSLQGYT